MSRASEWVKSYSERPEWRSNGDSSGALVTDTGWCEIRKFPTRIELSPEDFLSLIAWGQETFGEHP